MRYVITVENREDFEQFSVTRWGRDEQEAIEAWENELDADEWFEGVWRVVKVRKA
jgi:hypothetical protein